jgi:hypothetical protein
MQPQGLDELTQHAGQLRGGILGPRQLFQLLVAVDDSRQDIMGAGDRLQRLAQVMASHRQQCCRKIAVCQTTV